MKTAVSKAARLLFGFMLAFIAIVVGASSGIMMAEAANLPDAGKTNSGADGTGGTDGIATETQGRDDGDPNFYSQEIDSRIIKIRPMATPIDQISRYAKSESSGSFEIKYYSVGTRPIKCTLTEAVSKQTSGASVPLPVDDASMFTLDDTIRVVGVKGVYMENGQKYDSESDNVPDLILCVCGKNENSQIGRAHV